MEFHAAPASVTRAACERPLHRTESNPGHHLRRSPSPCRSLEGDYVSRGHDRPGELVAKRCVTAPEMPVVSSATARAHRVREIARLAIRHGWDIEGALRAAGMHTVTGAAYPRITRRQPQRSSSICGAPRTTSCWAQAEPCHWAHSGYSRSAVLRPQSVHALRRFGECRSALPGIRRWESTATAFTTYRSTCGMRRTGGLHGDSPCFDPSRHHWAIRRPLCLQRVDLPHRRPRGTPTITSCSVRR